eukprot:4379889-Amphidinium_carterae.1
MQSCSGNGDCLTIIFDDVAVWLVSFRAFSMLAVRTSSLKLPLSCRSGSHTMWSSPPCMIFTPLASTFKVAYLATGLSKRFEHPTGFDLRTMFLHL